MKTTSPFEEKKYSLKDYKSWGEEERWELIHGVPYNMSPAPLIVHQQVVLKIAGQLWSYFMGKNCEPFIAPVDVYITGSDEDTEDTVVQPDLFVVCDPAKVRDQGIYGAPDWICEVLSPYTAWKDQTEKRNLYEKYGVKEYWIVNPETGEVFIYRKEGERFLPPKSARLKDPTPVELFSNLVIRL